MKKVHTLAIGALLLGGALPLAAQAQEAGDMTLSGGVSSLGIYVEPTYTVNSQLSLRAPLYWGEGDVTLEDDGNSIDSTVESLSLALVADYFPWANGVFFSGGIAFGGYSASGNTNQVTANGNTYSGDFGMNIEQKSKVAPQVSVGYRRAMDTGMTFAVEAGARVATYEMSLSGIDSQPQQAQDDINAEVASINDSLSDFPVVPFISLSIGWRF
ncbi:hypothetical protein [Pseudooceanicola sp. HF7]|uniref:hypothetical protein n=1 Tax=Pseudooceanicola sp. HF7 TaxID=2721560 RepID=UPI00142F4FFB|nr:hypothetical protein [Pseudooceanicola sp. HF7]NIZ10898.1 hypothetical protein [Pseudooceanicola sp. HF7]